VKGSCLCGRVAVDVPGRPEYLNACNCTACTKLGALWGYFSATSVQVKGETRAFVRTDAPPSYVRFHFCDGCGTTTHWSPLAGDAGDRMGVNMRLFDPEDLAGVEVRYTNRRDDYEGERRYYRQPTIFGEAGVLA